MAERAKAQVILPAEMPPSPSTACGTPSPPQPRPGGALLLDISKALGHSTPATTGKIYTHLADQLHANTLAKVADALK